MPMERFLIAPFNTGLQTNLRPWLIMDDAFEELQNAFVFRGRVKKRFGSLWMGTSQTNSRLRISLGNNTNAAMNLPANSAPFTPQLAIGQMFSLGGDVFYVYQLGAGVATKSTNGSVSAVIDSVATPNTITFTGGALTEVNWYPSRPVVGITQYESGNVNNHPSYAFDPSFAYTFTGSPGTWVRSGTALWHGAADGSNFMWTCNWLGSTSASGPANTGVPVLFATNFNFTAPAPGATDDPIWYMTPANTWTAATGANAFYFFPNGGLIQTGPYVKTARIIVPFHNRLLLLNTVENDNSGGAGVNTQYKNRCRYSFYGTPFARNAWYEPDTFDSSGGVVNNNNLAAGAGFVDASTDEQIISAEFIKDRLIVYFERSTWELAYTGNELLPFIWQKLNTELGSQSTFSTVPFDKEILTIGNTGVHGCNGSNVARIDAKIPDEIFQFQARQNGNLRTAGIRDYFAECVYWAFVSSQDTPSQNFPNQILVYNYANQSWALNDDCFTAFGYFEQQTDTTWVNNQSTWGQSNETWSSGLNQANQRVIIAGNQEGFIVRIANDISRNAPGLQITNITYNGDNSLTLNIINHNFANIDGVGDFPDYILIEGVTGDNNTMNFLNGQIFPVNLAPTDPTNNIVIVVPGLLSGTYNGGGVATRVSNVQWLSKQFNPYDKESRNVYLSKIDFAVQKTEFGQITIDYYPSSTELPMIQEGYASGSIMGTNVLETSPYSPTYYPLEQYQQRLWHSIYFQSSGECIQLWAYFDVDQMVDPRIALSDFELEGMILYVQRTDSRMQ